MARKNEPVVAEVEAVQTAGGLGIDEGIILGTTLLLLVAIALVSVASGTLT
jgi:hypothetical protein